MGQALSAFHRCGHSGQTPFYVAAARHAISKQHGGAIALRFRQHVVHRAPQFDPVYHELGENRRRIVGPTFVPPIVPRLPDLPFQFDIFGDARASHQRDIAPVGVVLIEKCHAPATLDLAHLSTSSVGEEVDRPVIADRKRLDHSGVRFAFFTLRGSNAERQFLDYLASKSQKPCRVHPSPPCKRLNRASSAGTAECPLFTDADTSPRGQSRISLTLRGSLPSCVPIRTWSASLDACIRA
jgi:hypothetical protein